jgi:hypothetical protein
MPSSALLSMISRPNFTANGTDWPSLDEPFTPGAAESAAAQCVEATNRIVAAAEQMTATVRGPLFTLFDASMMVGLGHYSTSSSVLTIILVPPFSLIALCGTDKCGRNSS